MSEDSKPTIVIVGGGFGGMAAAKALREAPVKVVVIGRSNHHLFQPLLYPVAIAVLGPGRDGFADWGAAATESEHDRGAGGCDWGGQRRAANYCRGWRWGGASDFL